MSAHGGWRRELFVGQDGALEVQMQLGFGELADEFADFGHSSSLARPAPYESPVIMAGDNYEPRCAEHFVLPGRPH